jgi:VWFA-related protein
MPVARLLAQKDTTFSTGVKVVNVFATVRNKQGQIVRDLTKDDFVLDEDGRPQTIAYFSQESNLPLTLGLLIDTSGSQRRLIGQERSASFRFLEQVLREGKDQGFVIHFDREIELLQDVTSSRKKLEAALDLLESPQQSGGRGGGGGGGYPPRGGSGQRGGRGGGTTLYDAVLLASDELMKKQSGRKAVIVLSDGVDNGSKVSLGKSIEAAQRADTLAYSILFADEQGYGGNWGGYGGGRGRGGGGPRGRMPEDRGALGKLVLQRLSRETGGGFFEVSQKRPLEKVFSEIDDELRNQYSLGYTPDRSDAGSAFRAIHVVTKDRSLLVQSRDGYYPDR